MACVISIVTIIFACFGIYTFLTGVDVRLGDKK